MEPNAASPAALPDVDLIRRVPMMFIGDTSARSVLELCFEAIGLCLDAAVRGKASRIDVSVFRDQSLSVQCDGFAAPAAAAPDRTAAHLTTAFTAYRSSAAEVIARRQHLLTWMGLLFTPQNALSEWFEFTFWEQGQPLQVRFRHGYPAESARAAPAPPPAPNATRFHWRPDTALFRDIQVDVAALRRRLELDAFLAAGVTLTLWDEASGRKWTYCHQEGPGELVEVLTTGSAPLGEPIRIEHRAEWGQLSLGLQYYVGFPFYTSPGWGYSSHNRNDDAPTSVMYFANHRRLAWGTPAAAFWNALGRVWSDYLRDHDPLPEAESELSRRATGQCLRAAVSVRLPNPVWGSPVRERLMNDDLEAPMEHAIHAGLAEALPPILDRHPWLADHIRESSIRLCSWPRKIERWR